MHNTTFTREFKEFSVYESPPPETSKFCLYRLDIEVS